jgi:hypothetical protein
MSTDRSVRTSARRASWRRSRAFSAVRRSLVGTALLVAVIAASSSQAPAQTTLSLGQGPYAVFEQSNGTANGGVFTLTSSTIVGNVELGPNTSISKTSSTITGNLGKPMTNINAVASTISGYTATNLGNVSKSTPTITGNALVNVYSVGNLNLNSGSLTIKGTANEMLVFNVSGNVSISSSSLILSGLDASQVVFNVGGNVTITSSSAFGTFVNKNGSIKVTSSTVTGALVSQGNISVTGSTVISDPFVPAASVHAPEMPTIVSATFACLIAVGGTGIKRLRRW